MIITVGPSGRDYTSLAAAEAGEQTNLVTLGEPCEFVCDAFEDTTEVVFDGWTTSATRYIEVRAATGAEAQVPWSTSAYRLSAGIQAIQIGEEFTRIRNIQVENRLDDNNARGIVFNYGFTNGGVVEGCHVRSGNLTYTFGDYSVGIDGSVDIAGTLLIRNNFVAWGGFGTKLGVCAIRSDNHVSGNTFVYNNTVISRGGSGRGIVDTHNDTIAKNNLVSGFADGCFSADFGTGTGYNASSDSTAPGTGSRTSQTFTFVDSGAGNYRLTQTDGGGRTFGTDLTADASYPFTTTFGDTTRIAPWDIGAFESGVRTDISQVASSGGDYTSLSAWEAGEQKNLVASKSIEVAECQAFEDTTAFTIETWTTSPTNHIEIRAVTGAEARMPWSTSAYRLVASGYTAVITVGTANVRIRNIQIENTRSNSSEGAGCGIVSQSFTDGFLEIEGCVFRKSGLSASNHTHIWPVLADNSDAIIRNNVCIGGVTGIRCHTSGSDGAQVWVLNNTVVGASNHGIACTALYGTNDRFQLQNNLVSGSGTADYVTEATGTVDIRSHNASSDGTALGTNARTNQTFAFVDAAGGDYTLSRDDRGAHRYGTNLSADANYPYTSSFNGVARTDSWDIGATETLAGLLAGSGSYVETGTDATLTLGGGGGGDTRTLNHTAGATAAITLGAVFVVAADVDPTVTATYDGDAMTSVNEIDDSGNDYHLELFSIQPTTAPEVVFSSTTSAGLIKAMVAVSYDAVPSSAGVRSSVTATGTDDSPTATVTDVATNDKVVAFISWYGTGGIVADSASGEYLVVHTSSGNHNLAVIEAPGTNSTVVINPILSSAAPWQMVVAAVKSTVAAGYTLTADEGTYAVTGTAAALEQGYEVEAEAGAYALTGTAANLERGFVIVADPAAFVVTGTAAELEQGYEVTADGGAYAVSGTAATLRKTYRLVAESAAYAFTGTDATLLVDAPNRTLVAESGTYVLTGTAANLEKGSEVAADTGTYAFTGTAASLEKGYKVIADTAAYAVTGIAANLERGAEVAANTGAYAFTGTTANLEKGYRVGADTAGYAVTGTAANLEQGYEVAADAGAYAVAGTAANLEKGYRLGADAGSYAVTGTAATFLRGRVLVATTTTFTWTGTEAILSTEATLNAESGTVVVSTPQTALRKSYRLVSDATAYAVGGTAANLEQGYEVAAEAGAYTLTGTAANLERGSRVVAATAGYALTGSTANLRKGSRVGADSGTYVLTGSSASLGSNPTLNAEVGSYALTGTQATLRRTVRMVAEAGSVVESGTAANLEFGRRVSAATTAYAVTGSAATLKKGFYILAQATAVAVTGIAANTLANRRVTAEATDYVETGTAANLRKGYRLAGDAASYALTGSDADKRKQYMLSAAPVTWTVDAPIATNLLSARILRADADDYTLTGNDAYLGPVQSWTLAADPGDLDVIGPQTGLVYTPYSVLEVGTFELYETLETVGTVTITPQDEYVVKAVAAAPTQVVGGTIIAPDQTTTLIVSNPKARTLTKPLQAIGLVIVG